MKKALSILLAILLLLSLAPTAIAAAKTFTLLVYMCGTDLESDGGLATADLQEMVASGVKRGGNLNVVVQTGGTKQWATRGMTNREGERWLLSTQGMERLASLGRVNMGSGDTFADFLQFGIAQYPADRFGVIFWDHGAGSSDGVCYDEITGESLDMQEIYAAFQQASKLPDYRKFAMVGCDACLMADYEMAVHLAPFADLMIASEETEPGDGWDYQSWLPMLAKDAGADMKTVGKKIVDSFIDHVERYSYGDMGTLSVLDLTKMDGLHAAMETMGAALQGEIDGGNFNSISRIRQNVRSFGETSDAASDMIDLGVFASIFARYDEKGASALRKALADVVTYSRHTTNLSEISGLAVLVPYSTRGDAAGYLKVYDSQNLMPSYTSFVRSLANGMASGSYTFASSPVTQQSVQDATVDWFSQFFTDTDSYYDAYHNTVAQSTASPSSTAEPDAPADDFSLDGFLSTLFGET
ncbi:MAG: clostripain-related cysteine peptidase, partial [Candidatus Limiplasma sp.]|nr:clostripain-related cysteine peptidase [Candidatus Limiplasma sp.]